MSEGEEGEAGEAGDTSCCASCGIAEIDDVKLKDCDGCDLVRYCSDECQQDHKSKHEEECKKRAAELRDELLFKQPEGTYYGDCPICCLPIPLDLTKSTMMVCCSKFICEGCYYANAKREIEMRLDQKCAFCREPSVISEEEWQKRNMKRMEMNDPNAIYQQGVDQYNEGKYRSAFKYFTKAVALGNTEAHYYLSMMYNDGKAVERDEGKILHHVEEAAIGGHPDARYTLGCNEWDNNCNYERAVSHFIIAATQGHDKAIKSLMNAFRIGRISREELANALRAHKAAVDETKSAQREEAEVSSEYFWREG